MSEFNSYQLNFTKVALNFRYTDEQIARLLTYAKNLNENGCAIIYDMDHFSRLVGYDKNYMIGMSSHQNLFYKEYSIPKRHGGLRVIDQPLPDLLYVQRWILFNILNGIQKRFVSRVAKAFLKGKNIVDGARFHIGKNVLVSLDLVDFFGNIRFCQVYRIFRNIGYSVPVSTLLSNLCTIEGHLPQGSPTSPMISNLIFFKIDEILFNYCKSRHIMYTRYADDLSFSGDMNVGELVSYVTVLVSKFGFNINNKKTKVSRRNVSQRVTGIVVNSKLQAPISYRKRIRQEIYYIVKFGVNNHLRRINKSISTSLYLKSLLGKVYFVLSINPKDQEMIKYAEYLKEQLSVS